MPPRERSTLHSLWRELADGSAPIQLRLLVNLLFGLLLAGIALLAIFFAAALIPSFAYQSGSLSYPNENLLIVIIAIASVAFMAGTVWLWSHTGRVQPLLRPMLWTLGIAAVTKIVCLLVVSRFSGYGFPASEELAVPGFILLGIAAIMLVWTTTWYRILRGRPIHNQQDGRPDIRCPACGYRMTGLSEARCPECGARYTLDELLASQGFGQATMRSSQGRNREQTV